VLQPAPTRPAQLVTVTTDTQPASMRDGTSPPVSQPQTVTLPVANAVPVRSSDPTLTVRIQPVGGVKRSREEVEAEARSRGAKGG
jgi:hypothetical protein